VLFPSIFFFSSKRKKNTKKKKTIEKQKYVERGQSLHPSSHFNFSFFAPTFALLLLHFHFKNFFLASSSNKIKEKTKNTKKKKP